MALHIVSPNGMPVPDDSPFTEKVMALMAKALLDKPVALMIIWESGTEIKAEAVPLSRALMRGMITEISEFIELMSE